MTMIPGLVSTIIPVFNRPTLLREAVACVLEQTHRPIEIIVVDDGSTDNTPDVCRELQELHQGTLHVIRQENRGPGLAREAGRQAVSGEFIQYLDSDDWIHPRKFERQVNLLRRDVGCGVSYCKTRETDAKGQEWNGAASVRTGEALETLFPSLLSGRCWQTVTPLIRREVSDRAGSWADLGQEEDWEYDSRIALLGTKLSWCPEFLADYRSHSGPRAGGGSLADRKKMLWRVQAHVLIYRHAKAAGITADDEHMCRYARELFLLARQCGAMGLSVQSRELFDLARDASGPLRGTRWEFRLYRLATSILGWTLSGRLSDWVDRWRRTPIPSGEVAT
ncbi:MAG: glycosyltransferase family A protein [Thermoanaerobaculia bacterium]